MLAFTGCLLPTLTKRNPDVSIPRIWMGSDRFFPVSNHQTRTAHWNKASQTKELQTHPTLATDGRIPSQKTSRRWERFLTAWMHGNMGRTPSQERERRKRTILLHRCNRLRNHWMSILGDPKRPTRRIHRVRASAPCDEDVPRDNVTNETLNRTCISCHESHEFCYGW